MTGPAPQDPYYQAPHVGYTVPQQAQPMVGHYEPLISENYNGWWSRGVGITKRGWKPLALLQALGLILTVVIQVPVAAFVAVRSDDLTRDFTEASQRNTAPDLSLIIPLGAFALGGALLAIILAEMVTLATVHVGVSVAMGVPVSIGSALSLAGRRVFPLIGWQLLSVPIYLVGLCLCFLPVFYVIAVFTVLPVVVAVERTGAIGRCFSLFHRELGPSVGRIATILGLTLAASIAGGGIGAFMDTAARAASPGQAGIITGSVASTLFAAVISAALAVLLAPLTLTAYADMRARVEPTTSAVIAQQLGILPPPARIWPAWPPPADPFTGPVMPPR